MWKSQQKELLWHQRKIPKTLSGRIDMNRKALGLLLLCAIVPSLRAADWPPIAKQELETADDPANPGAAAIILFRELHTYDAKAYETEYRRIKILNDAGKKYADIEIPYFAGATKIEDIQARTTRPDGTSMVFQGQIFDRTVLRARKKGVQVKSFTLPDIQRGSIIEYSYTTRYRQKTPDVLKHPDEYLINATYAFPSAAWIVQEELFTVRARFVVHPLKRVPLTWVLRRVSNNVRPVQQKDGSTAIEIQNVPGFQSEELMPPEYWLKSRVFSFYVIGNSSSADYWNAEATRLAEDLKSFLGDSNKLKPMLREIISESDPPETQLRQLYSYVQKIRFLSFESHKTEQELERENIKENRNVEDVLKHKYAWANEINLSFVALAKAAGFESAPVLVASGDTTVFDFDLLDPSQLESMIVWVKAGGTDYFLDPATLFCPFDLLPWPESATKGIVVTDRPYNINIPANRSSNPEPHVLINTPPPTKDKAMMERAAELAIGPDGGIEGSLNITFWGQEALARRLAARSLNEEARKKSLEDEVKGWLTATTTAELQGQVNWEESERPLHAMLRLKIPEFASVTGRRILFHAGFFAKELRYFETGTRNHDIYFPYPFQKRDDITWKLPPGYNVMNLPAKMELNTQFGMYSLNIHGEDGRIRSNRLFTSVSLHVPVANYWALRAYFNQARQTDQGQIVLEHTGESNADD
jgi:hypothetical protein